MAGETQPIELAGKWVGDFITSIFLLIIAPFLAFTGK